MVKTKAFDCVEMKRCGAELVRQRLAGMTAEEEIRYWRRRSAEFSREQRHLQQARRHKPALRLKPDRT